MNERKSFDITKASAINLTKWKMREMLKDPKTPMLDKLGLNVALGNGSIDKVADILYGMDLTLAANESNPLHQQWLAAGAIVREPTV